MSEKSQEKEKGPLLKKSNDLRVGRRGGKKKKSPKQQLGAGHVAKEEGD